MTRGSCMPAMVERARRQMSARWSIVVVVAGAVAVVVVAVLARRYGFDSLALDRAAIRSRLAGDGLYAYRDPVSHLGAALPPAAAYALLPAALLPLPVAGWLLALSGLAALVLALIALTG